MLAEATCAAMWAADPASCAGAYLGRECLITGHFDMRAVSRAILVSLVLPVHVVKGVENRIPN